MKILDDFKWMKKKVQQLEINEEKERHKAKLERLESKCFLCKSPADNSVNVPYSGKVSFHLPCLRFSLTDWDGESKYREIERISVDIVESLEGIKRSKEERIVKKEEELKTEHS